MCPNIYVFTCFFLCSKFFNQLCGVLSYNMNQYATIIQCTDNTPKKPDPKSYCIKRNKWIHGCLDIKFNFILYSILHSRQLYFNYIPTVFYLKSDFNNYNNVNTTTVLTILDNSKLWNIAACDYINMANKYGRNMLI